MDIKLLDIIYRPTLNRVLFAIGCYKSESIIIPNPNSDVNGTALACGFVVAVGPNVVGIKPGDWIEVQRNVIQGGLSVVNDLRGAWPGNGKGPIMSQVPQDQICGVIEFTNPENEPALLTDNDLEIGVSNKSRGLKV